MALCTECGANVSDEIQFCTSCGARMAQDEQPAKPAVQTQTPPQKQAPGGSEPQTGGTVMSTGAYVGLMLLFALPVIGFLFCLILAFTGKNQNRRNFSKAILIFMIIGLVLGIVAYFVSGWALEAAQEYLAAQDLYSLAG